MRAVHNSLQPKILLISSLKTWYEKKRIQNICLQEKFLFTPCGILIIHRRIKVKYVQTCTVVMFEKLRTKFKKLLNMCMEVYNSIGHGYAP